MGVSVSCVAAASESTLREAGLELGALSVRQRLPLYLRCDMEFPDAKLSPDPQGVVTKGWEMLSRGLGNSRSHAARLDTSFLRLFRDRSHPAAFDRMEDLYRFFSDDPHGASAILMTTPDASHVMLLHSDGEPELSYGYLLSEWSSEDRGRDPVDIQIFRIAPGGEVKSLAPDEADPLSLDAAQAERRTVYEEETAILAEEEQEADCGDPYSEVVF